MPTYLAMGMSSEEYWRGDPYLTVVYRKAWDLKKQQRNEFAWWQGLYVYEAVATVAKNMTRKKGERAVSYPNSPHDVVPETEEQIKEKKARAREDAINYFNNLKQRLDGKYGKRDQFNKCPPPTDNG